MGEQELTELLATAKRYIRLAAMLAVVLITLTLIDVQVKRAIVEQVRAAQRLLAGLTDAAREADEAAGYAQLDAQLAREADENERAKTAGEAGAADSPVPDTGDGVGGAAAAGAAVDKAAADGAVPRSRSRSRAGGVAARPRGNGRGTEGQQD